MTKESMKTIEIALHAAPENLENVIAKIQEVAHVTHSEIVLRIECPTDCVEEVRSALSSLNESVSTVEETSADRDEFAKEFVEVGGEG